MDVHQHETKRPPTSGVPIGMKPPSKTAKDVSNPIASNKKISIKINPMSKNGLPSVNIQSGKRQIADKTYYIGILRNKINEIIKEIKNLNTKIYQNKQEQSVQTNLEQLIFTLKKEITKSEAELSDYNVLVDHVQNGIYIDVMIAEFQTLEQSNSKFEEEVNKKFRELKDLEKRVLEQENNVKNLLNGKDFPEVDELNKEIELIESKCTQIKESTVDLKGKTKEEMLHMIKDTTNKIGDTEKMIQNEKKSLSYIQEQIKNIEEKEKDLNSDRGKKYLKLLQKEKEMNSFFENFQVNLDHTKEEIYKSQKNVYETLKNTSFDIESVQDIPTGNCYKHVKENLADKEKQVKDAQFTIKIEIDKQRSVLEHWNEIDKKIQDEIESNRKKIKEMEVEMPKYNSIDLICHENEIINKGKRDERDQLLIQINHLKKATNVLTSNYNKLNHKLKSDELNNKLHELEIGIRNKVSENNVIKEAIEENKRITNYEIVKRDTLNIVNEINSFL